MSMEEGVVQAVEAMYASGSPADHRAAADEFLRKFQRDDAAFATCYALLSRPAIPSMRLSVHYVHAFCAQTISHMTLLAAERDSLTALFALHRERDIVRLLGTALVRNMESSQGLDWLMLGAWDDDVRLSLLTLAAKDGIAYSEAPKVIVWLGKTNVASADALRCLAEWINMLDDTTRDPELVVPNPVANAALQVLRNGMDDNTELFDAAVDVVIEIIRAFPSAERDMHVIQWLLPQLMGLKPLFAEAAAYDNTDCCIGLTRIFTEMAEMYLNLILSESPMNQTAVVDMLLDCMAYPDAEIAEITMPFWFVFCDALISSRDPGTKARLLATFTPSLTRLSLICMQNMCFRDGFRELPSDKKQDFKNFRADLGDILRDCCHLLGAELVLQHCVQGLQTIFQSQESPERQWEAIEAHLYSFRSIARKVELQIQSRSNFDETPLHSIFSYLPQFPDHPAIKYTSCLIISRYAEWLGTSATSYLPSMLQFIDATIQQCLSRKDYQEWQVPTAVSAGLRSLCIDCWKHVGRDLIEYYVRLQASDALLVEDQVILLEGICKGVSIGDRQLMVPAMQTLVTPIAQHMSEIFARDHPSANGILKDLLRLMCIYDHITVSVVDPNATHPLVALTEQLFPLFQQTLRVYGHNAEVVERSCRCFKRMLRVPQMKVVVPTLAELLVTHFEAHPQSSYLYCASMILKHFASDADCAPIFEQLLLALSRKTFGVLQESSHAMVDNPDIVEEFFYLIERYLRCLPLQTVPLLPSVFQCALAGLAMQHNDANKGVLSCLQLLLQQMALVHTDPTFQPYYTTVDECLRTQGHLLVHALLRGVMGHLSGSRVDADHGSCAGVLLCIAQLHGNLFQEWVTSVLGAMETGPKLKPDEKQKFLETLLASTDEGTFRRTIRHFSKLCKQCNVYV
ncbi:hypothetical protein SPRG_20517 [Saprolegnia parasitica CBS 223.65]|uniref:Exportin-1/Importin-beta-like domain-containing protein n=1 Tax=Saprolegnia parasitica (strain CBS 223.65) TaxID=695850 RepID=A0A067C7K6_SAPPC|nr:hypothetical protein SPRG_20517 [Saprolegnia parasitica CBS 223.65]KDO26719.1 hypothetical protein SPRG_20517 [Saprolegnia parasitica CBS 223.65]|eukprot:XP_012202603.1 hypothetical protein SPRG_20517 [Saprolegnia parasitica CBS 223.65]